MLMRVLMVLFVAASVLAVPTASAGTCSQSLGDDDTWSLEESLFVVDEDAGKIVISVTRDGTAGGCTGDIHYQTIPGTATQGQDFEFTSGDLHWDAFDFATKTFDVIIFDNGQAENVETFRVEISALADEGIGPIDEADVRIQDDDAGGATTVTSTTTTTRTITLGPSTQTTTTTQTVATTTTVQESPSPLLLVVAGIGLAVLLRRRA